MLQRRLPPQLLGDAHRLDRPEASDPLGPVRVLGVTRPLPVARHERVDAVGDHPATASAPFYGADSRLAGFRNDSGTPRRQ